MAFVGGGVNVVFSKHVANSPAVALVTYTSIEGNPGLNNVITVPHGDQATSVEVWVSYANDRLWMNADGVSYPVACCAMPGKNPWIDVHKKISLKGVHQFYFYADDGGCSFEVGTGGPSGFGGVVYRYKVNYGE